MDKLRRTERESGSRINLEVNDEGIASSELISKLTCAVTNSLCCTECGEGD